MEWGAFCSIDDADWAPPPRPADCDLGWGSDVELGDDAFFACVGDVRIYRQPEEVSYGSEVERGRYACAVEETGVTCRNADTGAGFSISRSRYELFGE